MSRVIYLLCFRRRGQPAKVADHAGHYCGSAEDLERRLQDHKHGRGSHLTRAAREQGLTFRLVRLWQGTRADERRLKSGHDLNRLCPDCNEHPRPVRWLTDKQDGIEKELNFYED